MTTVVYKFIGKDEQRKPFPDLLSAMRWQGQLLKKSKRDLEYATYE